MGVVLFQSSHWRSVVLTKEEVFLCFCSKTCHTHQCMMLREYDIAWTLPLMLPLTSKMEQNRTEKRTFQVYSVISYIEDYGRNLEPQYLKHRNSVKVFRCTRTRRKTILNLAMLSISVGITLHLDKLEYLITPSSLNRQERCSNKYSCSSGIHFWRHFVIDMTAFPLRSGRSRTSAVLPNLRSSTALKVRQS